MMFTIAAVTLGLPLMAQTQPATTRLPALKPVGKHMVDPRGNRVTLRGVNLGNWFVIEPWMLAMTEGDEKVADQFEFEQILESRFGSAERQRLMEVYRTHWLSEKDFQVIRSFRFNLIRLPLNYRQFEDDSRPMRLRPDAWKWVDRAVDLAERHGMYVILDMHGVQGGQSVYDHTGHAGQNKLWGSAENQARLAWLWRQIAQRYRNRSAVVAYDVFNEPYGGSKADQVKVFRQSLASIRSVDPDKLVFAHGNWDTFTHYGNPAENGWRNVGFQMHYYPGLFGNGQPTITTHARHVQFLEGVARQVDAWNVPFLVGEMNVVFQSAGGPSMMRRMYDIHEKNGWMTTMWSYKVLSRAGRIGNASWGMVTNAEAWTPPNLRADSKTQIEAKFRSLSSMKLEVYGELREKLAAVKYSPPPLPALPPVRLTAPGQDSLPGWSQVDIGGSRPGGMVRRPDGALALYGGGDDIWGSSDQFRFLHQRVRGDFTVDVMLKAVEDVEAYTKAGLMVRAGLDADAPHALVSMFPGGGLQFARRESPGGTTTEVAALEHDRVENVRLRIVRRGAQLTAFVQLTPSSEWRKMGETTLPALGAEAEVGVVSLSHDNGRLAEVIYRDLRLSQP